MHIYLNVFCYYFQVDGRAYYGLIDDVINYYISFFSQELWIKSHYCTERTLKVLKCLCAVYTNASAYYLNYDGLRGCYICVAGLSIPNTMLDFG